MKLTLVTGNINKLEAWKRLVPSDVELDAVDIDLVEIQSFDSVEIITDKARRAYEIVGKPVVVEDITAGIDSLNGLPGPFIKFFEQRLGKDALFQLAGEQRSSVTATIGHYDGTTLTVATGTVHGTVVAARGEGGFGFDCCFQPDGHNKTYAEMQPAEKDAISHRAIAVRDLLDQLKRL